MRERSRDAEMAAGQPDSRSPTRVREDRAGADELERLARRPRIEILVDMRHRE